MPRSVVFTDLADPPAQRSRDDPDGNMDTLWGVKNDSGDWMIREVRKEEAVRMYRKNKDSYDLVYTLPNGTTNVYQHKDRRRGEREPINDLM